MTVVANYQPQATSSEACAVCKRPEERHGPGANIHPGFGPDGRRRKFADDDDSEEEASQEAVLAAHKRMADGEDPGYANPYLGFHQPSSLREVGDEP